MVLSHCLFGLRMLLSRDKRKYRRFVYEKVYSI